MIDDEEYEDESDEDLHQYLLSDDDYFDTEDW